MIQEVALATGNIPIQCGHDTCDFHDFYSAQLTIVENHPEDDSLRQQFLLIERISNTIIDLRHAYTDDRLYPLLRVPTNALAKIVTTIFSQEQYDLAYPFHQQSFPQRLHLILFKTAGHFRCRDDRDRLYAVLSIAKGTKTDGITAMAFFAEFIRFSGLVVIYCELLVKYSSRPTLIMGPGALGLAISTWRNFYWPITRHCYPSQRNYDVAGYYEEDINAIVDGPPGCRSQGEFFTALARYLANETKVLTFLDAANCGEDCDEGMPSWVPNWTRKLGYKVCEFVTHRLKEYQAPANFQFDDSGKTLRLLGWSRGAACVTPLRGLLLGFSERIFGISRETLHQLLLGGVRTLIHGSDEGVRVMGVLRAGEAAMGDRLVFVPGCFHHLILRKQTQITVEARWKLVGLVDMTTEVTKERCYSKSEVAQFLKDRAAKWYAIV